jgi:hypothetical protein
MVSHGVPDRIQVGEAQRRCRVTALSDCSSNRLAAWRSDPQGCGALQWVVDDRPRRDTLAFQVDLWSARGEFPRDMFEAMTREKEIRSSFYDTLKSTLERLVDFDRLNAGEVRFSVGAVNIRTGRGRTPSVRST